MILKFNIFLELAVIPLDFILCVFFLMRYKDDTRVNREFKLLSLLVLFGTVLDVVNAVSISLGSAVPLIPRYALNTLNYVSATLGAYQFVRYVISYVGEQYSRTTGAFINRVLLGIYFLIILQNIFFGTVFSYLPEGNLVIGPLYMLVVYAYPLYYIMCGGVFILSHSESYARKMKYALAATFAFVVLLYGVQMFFYQNLLVTFFVASLALLVMFLTLETPDYAKLRRTLEELSVSKRELEASSIRATEASHAKSRFLAQMSNDIRTPVNAIMGYSNLILADTEEEATKEYTRRVKISAKRLLTFFENVLNYISEETDENGPRRLPSMAELIERIDENEFIDGDATSNRTEISGASEMRILVVDDTAMNLDIMVRMLTPMGFTVDTAANGQQAVIQVRKFRYDLIFMDHLMPVMDGVEALKHLREEHLCDNTPVIMLTANAIAGQDEEYLSKGFAAYLAKPFTEDMVLDILKQFLSGKGEILSGEMDLSVWENFQEKLPMVRVAKPREYLLHDIKLYKKLLEVYSKEDKSSELSAAIRQGNYDESLALIRSEHDKAQLIGAENLVKMTEKLEALCRKKEFELLRERIGAFVSERNELASAVSERL
ncbi:ATP-binding response regulator [Butyrivibrio sp. FC2001]|uniref:ATP-binding response regulator n=1 Tax=Butyrivibrio sp. FC2001 TaxID=1280671 RepID=UPI00042A0F96|nr:response regulator [Butyrivibrio sp. FC2001]